MSRVDSGSSTEQLAQRFKGKGPWKKGQPTLLQTLGRAQPVEGDGGEVVWRGNGV